MRIIIKYTLGLPIMVLFTCIATIVFALMWIAYPCTMMNQYNDVIRDIWDVK